MDVSSLYKYTSAFHRPSENPISSLQTKVPKSGSVLLAPLKVKVQLTNSLACLRSILKVIGLS